ncbi:LytTR family DNA-binding domain-containing protein [Mycolicibacterium sp. CBMA 226]|uniref:LytR/AlgR family response regulator transcription factor n=1 Tax=Mycolicibacterium sp. CBMA 226 TaxID=2606611 RepID=UPI0012DFC8E0|nr:response regulator [Mycolicibacterium sp. CBMA 226]MUL79439.1 response regulator [Mycolicibacterium sp. CBMA 226]
MTNRQSLRCVIVDDNADYLAAATTLLQQGGIDVIGTAQSVSDGLNTVERLRPDIALVDVHLGEESGFDLVAQLSSHAGTAAVMAILTSTFTDLPVEDLTNAPPRFLPKLDLSGDAIRALIA